MADNADIVVEILPIEQAHLQIELKVFESLLKTMNYSTMFTYSGIAGELELDVNKFTQHLTDKITELKTELEKYKPKQHTITTDIDFNSNTFIEKKPTNE